VGAHAATKNKTKRGFAYLAVAGGALAMTIGGVFAANSITVNSGAAIEFGQGLASTSSCETTLTATVAQAYNVSADKFYASTVTISNVDDTACDGKTIHVSLIGTSAVVCSVDGTHTTGTNKDAFTIASGDTSLTVTIPSACDASTVKKVAITTS
jgi:hypothetical protein